MAPVDDLTTLVGKAGQYFNDARPLFPMYTHLILSAIFPIYVGAHASLSRPSSAAKPVKNAKSKDGDEEEEEQVQKMEGLSNRDAIVLPITAGVTLGTLYFLITRYGAELINLFMSVYFAGVGIFSVAQFVNDGMNVLVGLVFPTYFWYGKSLVKIDSVERKAFRQDQARTKMEDTEISIPAPWLSSRLPQWMLNRIWDLRQLLKQKFAVKAYLRAVLELKADMTIISVLSAFIGLGATYYVNRVSRTWFLTNLQGFSACYYALQLLSPTTFITGTLILSALFFYDIWAVFFTPLMVTVATNLDQPIKLVFPKPDEPSETPGAPPVKSYSMLGLGDIVVPGLMIGLALRFDLYMFYLKKQRKQKATRQSLASASSHENVKKAPYVPVTGRWGDRIWTCLLPTASLPPNLRTSFSKVYFIAAMVGYLMGMLTTLSVMHIFHHAQPALLYLVPGVLLSLWGTALARGELREMWHFSEGIDASQVEEDPKKASPPSEAPEAKSQKGLFERLWAETWGGEKGDESTKPSVEDTDTTPQTRRQATKGSETKKADAMSAARDGPNADHNLLFSFSVGFAGSKAGAASKISRTKSITTNDSKASLASSPDSSEDVIVVSSADLKEGQAVASSPRRRTRSTRGVSRGRS